MHKVLLDPSIFLFLAENSVMVPCFLCFSVFEEESYICLYDNVISIQGECVSQEQYKLRI